MLYDHRKIEKKWQDKWEDSKIFKTDINDKKKKKYYVLDMFPYPSGEGLHVGHPEGYTATDIIARYKKMNGYNVLHPMGFDAFGLPAEQYALKTGKSPAEFTKKNILNFKRQIKSLGFSYDWDLEINTSDPKYYKWTQWIFIKLYEKGLAKLKEVPVNWCPKLNCVLSNEEVVNGLSERGSYPVYRVPMKQWTLKITKYAERLLKDLDDLDWPENIKESQRNWIGKKTGYDILLTLDLNNIVKKEPVFIENFNNYENIEFIILTPESQYVKLIKENNQELKKYLDDVSKKSTLERLYINKIKKGINTGYKVTLPLTNKIIPIWIADYIIGDEENSVFFGIPKINKNDNDFLIQNNIQNNFVSLEIEKIFKKLKDENLIQKKIKYKLHDWIFSRQRFWGEPFPIIFFEDGSVIVDHNLPVELPITDKVVSSKDMKSPLSNFKEWVEVDGSLYGKKNVIGYRDTNTMPQWAGSSWYYLRYIDSKNDNSLADYSKLDFWLPVDLYVGGKEHAVLHLLYVRFWHKVLYDIGVVPYKEPIKKLVNQGMILGSDNTKMSKSKGNVINPDEIIKKYGADSLRIYEMFLGPIEADKPWSDKGINASRKFLEKIFNLFLNSNISLIEEKNKDLDYEYNYTVKKVTEDIESLKFNTAISQLMIFINYINKNKFINLEYKKGFIKLLSPFAPHISEEIWSILGEKESIFLSEWPKYDNDLLSVKNVTYAIQLNGKLRSTIIVNNNENEEMVKKLSLERIEKYIENKRIKKIIFIKNKIVNIVI